MFCLLCMREWAQAIDEARAREALAMQAEWDAIARNLPRQQTAEDETVTRTRVGPSDPRAFNWINTHAMRDLCDRLETCRHGARG